MVERKPENVEKLERLRADPMAKVQVETPTSERVTTPVGGYMGDYRKAGSIDVQLGTAVARIDEDAVTLRNGKTERAIENDAVFTMIGREAPLEFFRRSGVRIRGESTPTSWIALTESASVAALSAKLYAALADTPFES